jgi:pimeloyl-ACP methyl ester carboxylesterase
MTPDVLKKLAVSVSRIESLATCKFTPCGTGSMVWRVWGNARPLVLLLGASGSWTHWIRNIATFAARFRVFVPDLPGFGNSDMPSEPHTAHAR